MIFSNSDLANRLLDAANKMDITSGTYLDQVVSDAFDTPITTDPAEAAVILSEYGVRDAHDTVRNYEKDIEGELTTPLIDSVKVLQKLGFILGENYYKDLISQNVGNYPSLQYGLVNEDNCGNLDDLKTILKREISTADSNKSANMLN